MSRPDEPSRLDLPPRRARLFRSGKNQAVRIPREYEFTGDEVLLYREGNRLIVEQPQPRSRLLDLLARLEPLDDAFRDVDEGLPALDPVLL